MDRVSSETMMARMASEQAAIATPQDEPLSSPLAEIAARGRDGEARPAQNLKRRRSISRPQSGASRPRRGGNRRSLSPGEVVVGTLSGINDQGQPLVRHPLDPSGRVMRARTTVPITLEQVDREVVLGLESGDPGKPIVLGVLHRPDGREMPEFRTAPSPIQQPILQTTLDGERLVLTARNEIILRCGEASLTITRAGKVLIRGNYVLSRSSGVNRIKGGSVQIN